MNGLIIACFALAVAGCSTTSAEYIPAECVSLPPLVLRDACAPGEAPALTPLEGGGQVGSCTVLSRADLWEIAGHNAELGGRCAEGVRKKHLNTHFLRLSI